MNMKQQICEAFCAGISVRPVPIGFAIATPFPWLTGDNIVVYARIDGERVRLEDGGSTVFDLETAGVDLSTTTRLEIIDSLGKEYGVLYEQTDVIFHTGWAPIEDAGQIAVRFVSFMQRMQDLVFTTRERAASTFREDLVEALRIRFRDDASIDIGEAPVESLKYYTVDIVVRHKNGKTAAIFPGTTEQKALEAVLFAKEIELKNIKNVVPFLIFERMDSSKVNKDTRAKALNSELQLAAWDGGALDVIDKVEKHVSAAA